jgi:hypothetical protein
MAYLFDTDAISELLRPRPLSGYVRWLGQIPREAQYSSAVTLGELFRVHRWTRPVVHGCLQRLTDARYDGAWPGSIARPRLIRGWALRS